LSDKDLCVVDIVSSPTKFEHQSATILANLNQRGATKYEQGLASLGELLGAQAFKPSGKGRTDAAWVWDSLWITVAAKSEQEPEGLLSMEYVRKTNTQLASWRPTAEVKLRRKASRSS
jgi:hypothetical protein